MTNDNQITQSITGLSADSRTVKPGYLFAALEGTKADGAHFITDAIKKGATYILAKTGTAIPTDVNVTLITDDDPRHIFSELAAAFYKNQPETIVAVTGTNGKTSIVNFTSQLWDALEHNAASLGTLGVISKNLTRKGSLTTPDPVTLHETLNDLASAGVTHLAMEASSIGIDQRRLDGVKLAAAAFTNLTHDHLDYHGTMDAYYACKKRLFTTLLPEDAPAVIYTDDPYGEKLASELEGKRPCIRIGTTAPEIKILEHTPTPDGQIIKLEAWGRPYALTLPLAGFFQGFNALIAAGLVMATNTTITFDMLVPALEKLKGVSGRLQRVDNHPKGAGIYVDYAHTPHGLETVLKSLRPHTRKNLVVVFGCGGNRDKTKRPIMGRIAGTFADTVFITDDNPRDENPETIRAEIAASCPQAIVIGDRKKAIFEALSSLTKDDILVIAGKGHEQGQIINNVVHPFDDVTVTKENINAL